MANKPTVESHTGDCSTRLRNVNPRVGEDIKDRNILSSWVPTCSRHFTYTIYKLIKQKFKTMISSITPVYVCCDIVVN